MSRSGASVARRHDGSPKKTDLFWEAPRDRRRGVEP